MKARITIEEIDRVFKEAGIEIVDDKCFEDKNHIQKDVEEYLRLKWEDGVEFTDDKILEVATTLLKELDE